MSTRGWLVPSGVLLSAAVALAVAGAFPPPPYRSPIDADEDVVFFPTIAVQTGEEGTWIAAVHGWIFEPEDDSLLRGLALDGLAKALGLTPHAAEDEIFRRRARLFLADNQRGQRISVRLGEVESRLPFSAVNGHFAGGVSLTAAQAAPLTEGSSAAGLPVRVTAVTRKDDERRFAGDVWFLPAEGVSVVSDVDDTVKVSEVGNRQALLERTFLREFEAVAGMPELYAGWRRQGASFHYVSSSPWQLYPPLAQFLGRVGLPGGSWHMKMFRFKDSDFFNLFEDPHETKTPVIEQLLETLPRRRFVLVGDSGEADPEIYGEIARRYPLRVSGVFIRAVGGADPADERFETAFRDVPRQRWTVFADPAELAEVDLSRL